MTRYNVAIADEAWAEIEKQVHYIAVERQAPENAAKWISRLLLEIDSLAQFPRRHALDEHQSDFLAVNVHRLVFERTYLVFYTVDDSRRTVEIVAFRHGARDPNR